MRPSVVACDLVHDPAAHDGAARHVHAMPHGVAVARGAVNQAIDHRAAGDIEVCADSVFRVKVPARNNAVGHDARVKPNIAAGCRRPSAAVALSILDGKVTGITKFGAFVSLPEGRSGLVHISEISAGFVTDINEHLKVGDVVKVLVLDVDEKKKRISLSMKQVKQ